MVVACLAKNTPIRILPQRQKQKTWKFAAEFLWKRQFEKDQVKFGKWTKDQLVELGPTFIKLGQIASTRADLYPIEFISQLESLQDNVPPIDKDSIENIIKDHVVSEVFLSFDYEPFKSASIGQVHRAVLKDGHEVVVKLKRPDIYNIMKRDTDDVKDIVNFLEKVGVDTGATSGYVLDESIDYLLAETDYNKEIDNAIKFRKSFKKVKWIKVPKVYRELSNNDMIVMEYVESEKLA